MRNIEMNKVIHKSFVVFPGEYTIKAFWGIPCNKRAIIVPLRDFLANSNKQYSIFLVLSIKFY